MVLHMEFSDIDYDDRIERLTVEFDGGGRYAYFGVPPREHRAFVESDAKPSFFRLHILDRYPFARVS